MPEGNNGSGTASGIVSQVQQTVQPTLEQAQQKTGALVSQVQQQATSQVEQQKQQVANSFGTVAETLRQTGQQLRDNDSGVVTRYAALYGETAAKQLEQFSNYLRDTDTSQLIHEVENFARRNPTLFVGGAFLLGLVAARFLKSSPPPPPRNSTHIHGISSITPEGGSFYPMYRMRAEEG
ncbi:MAG: hypothetical protein JO316_23965 [Abitibacteriaceae bacterium]|nr:hypothetical protein [Abditibacteriaceae bacterium]